MLNRTTSTTQTGLNLDLRTLATLAGLNTVGQNLVDRHDHFVKRKDSMRVGDAKAMRDSSITIRGPLFAAPSPSLPSCPSWPSLAEVSGARPVVVKTVVARVPVSAPAAARSSRAARLRSHAEPGFTGRLRVETARAECIPAACSYAAGG